MFFGFYLVMSYIFLGYNFRGALSFFHLRHLVTGSGSFSGCPLSWWWWSMRWRFCYPLGHEHPLPREQLVGLGGLGDVLWCGSVWSLMSFNANINLFQRKSLCETSKLWHSTQMSSPILDGQLSKFPSCSALEEHLDVQQTHLSLPFVTTEAGMALMYRYVHIKI